MSWFSSFTRKTASKSQNNPVQTAQSAGSVRRSAIRSASSLMDHVGVREVND